MQNLLPKVTGELKEEEPRRAPWQYDVWWKGPLWTQVNLHTSSSDSEILCLAKLCLKRTPWVEKTLPYFGIPWIPLAQGEFRISRITTRCQIMANLTNYDERICSYFMGASSIKLGKILLLLPLPLYNKLMIASYFLHSAEGIGFQPLGEECWEN